MKVTKGLSFDELMRFKADLQTVEDAYDESQDLGMGRMIELWTKWNANFTNLGLRGVLVHEESIKSCMKRLHDSLILSFTPYDHRVLSHRKSANWLQADPYLIVMDPVIVRDDLVKAYVRVQNAAIDSRRERGAVKDENDKKKKSETGSEFGSLNRSNLSLRSNISDGILKPMNLYLKPWIKATRCEFTGIVLSAKECRHVFQN
jgi:hypothetical protein